MRNLPTIANPIRGSSLVEATIAMGVLAIAIPLVFGALAESSKTTLSSEAESHSTWIIPTCVQEIQATRTGSSQFFPSTKTHETFPPQGEIWALAFSKQGESIGRITQADYTNGARQIDGKTIRYIAKLSAVNRSPTEVTPHSVTSLRVKITLEFPAISPVTKRQKLQFYTQIP